MKKVKTWVKIINNGEIELGGLHLMGVSSKRGDSEKIGFFGSGNKYAIALLLREKIPFKIFSGESEINIETKDVMFRSKLYEQIIINGELTSLTTSMGIDWETWFAVRELYCNALDEGEASMNVTQETKGEKGKTIVYVALTEKLGDFFKDINNYILVSKEGVLDSVKTSYGKVDVLSSNGEQFIAYRKGIRIFPKNEIKHLWNYNFDSIEINESRVYKYEHEVLERVASFLTVCSKKEIVQHFLHGWKGMYEENAKWEYTHDKLSETWHDILLGQRVYPVSLAIDSGDFEGKRNSFIVPDKLADKIADEFPDIEVVGKKNGKTYEVVEMNEKEKEMFSKAVKELEDIGYRITSEIKLAITTTKDVIGWYDKEEDCIYHTREHLTTLKELKNTLLEEHFHSKGQVDGQRSFVTFLIDEILNRS